MKSRTARLLDRYLDGHHVFVDESQYGGLQDGKPVSPVMYVPRSITDPAPWMEVQGGFRWRSRYLSTAPATVITGGAQLTVQEGGQR
jgi:hypothetical protein